MSALNMAKEEQPRERLLAYGAQALKDEELLAILFRTGTPAHDVLEMSKILLARYGSLHNLAKAHPSELFETPAAKARRKRRAAKSETGTAGDGLVIGIGEAKAVTLLAALELGRRAAFERKRTETLKERLGQWALRLAAEPREFIISIYLDESDRPIADDMLSYGGLYGASLDAPYLMKRAVRLNAYALVLMHNHPDGSTAPSGDDMQLSLSIAKMLKVLDIDYYGHYITAKGALFRIKGDGSKGRDVIAQSDAERR